MAVETKPIKDINLVKKGASWLKAKDTGWYLLWMLAVQSGCRISELTNLTWDERVNPNQFKILNRKKYANQQATAERKSRKAFKLELESATIDNPDLFRAVKMCDYKQLETITTLAESELLMSRIDKARGKVAKFYVNIYISDKLSSELDAWHKKNHKTDGGNIFACTSFRSNRAQQKGHGYVITRTSAWRQFSACSRYLNTLTDEHIHASCHGLRKTHARIRIQEGDLSETMSQLGWHRVDDALRYTGISEEQSADISKKTSTILE